MLAFCYRGPFLTRAAILSRVGHEKLSANPPESLQTREGLKTTTGKRSMGWEVMEVGREGRGTGLRN